MQIRNVTIDDIIYLTEIPLDYIPATRFSWHKDRVGYWGADRADATKVKFFRARRLNNIRKEVE